jgi:hypothetical protein
MIGEDMKLFITDSNLNLIQEKGQSYNIQK